MSTSMIRTLFLTLIAGLLCLGTHARADERIQSFKTEIKVESSGDIIVTEHITIKAESQKIRHGIFRDLPRFYKDEANTLPYEYKIIKVQRDGKLEPYSETNTGNALQVRIGDADIFIPQGQHEYLIKYRVKHQIRRFDDYDEIYWNVTGNYWDFPIDKATATITLPKVGLVKHSAYTGGRGSTAHNYTFSQNGNIYRFETTKPLDIHEGFTVALGFEKGGIAPLTEADKAWYWWLKNGAITLLSLSFLGILGYYFKAWNKVGRDPVKGPVFPRYSPPENLSAAASHKILNNFLVGHQALIATLMGLSFKKKIKLDVDKKMTFILPLVSEVSADMNTEEAVLFRALFEGRDAPIVLDKKYNRHFSRAYSTFKQHIGQTYGDKYHKYNLGYVITGIMASVASVLLAFKFVYGAPSLLAWLIIAGLFLANIIFAVLMPAPTRLGQDIKTEIKGLKLYLETAEKGRLNKAEIGSERPPPMSAKLYERFLPYAIALDVEKPWTQYFEKTLPEEARAYKAQYASSYGGNYSTLGGMNSALMRSLDSGVSSAMPSSSGSSGSGGGGFSGGGGGGGGGGGW